MRHFAIPPLYPIIDLDYQVDPLDYLSALVSSDVGIVQLRSKMLSDSAFSALAGQARKLCSQASINPPLLIINDRVSVCINAAADGVHLGQSDLSPIFARQMLGPDAWIGLSTHNLDQVRAAAHLPINYLGFGPIFDSPTKQGHAPTTGLSALREAVLTAVFPIVAIGGITLEKSMDVYNTGASSVAVISDLANARTVKEHVLAYQRLFINFHA